MAHNENQRDARRTIARAVFSWRKTGNKGFLKKAAILADFELEDEFLNWLIEWTKDRDYRHNRV